MNLRVADTIRLFTIDLQTRMPFRYGIAALTSLPHLLIELKLEIDGKVHRGVASENLAPKWFTKDRHTTPQQDIAQMLSVVRSACAFAEQAASADSIATLWRTVYDQQSAWGAKEKLPPLLANFGTTLIERALIDAFCRATGQRFDDAVRTNALGMTEFPHGLPPQPLRSLVVRHTVGLSDPLTDAEIPPDEKLDDGLPQSLESCVRAYGLTHFKIKIGGDMQRDVQRLRDIAAVLWHRDSCLWRAEPAPQAGMPVPPVAPQAGMAVRPVAFTLDGNESYRDVDSFRAFWRAVEAEPFMRRLLFVEQPLHRDVAFTAGLEKWPDRPPIIIDESDAESDSFRLALTRGYAGTSFKSCKGVFKGIANARLANARGAILSAEDLTTVGPIALMQDLAVVATLGIPHVERNGHHYFRGLSMFAPDLQHQVLAAHGDLYRASEGGFPTLDIRAGEIAVGSVVDAPFGRAADIDVASNFAEVT